MEVLNGVWPPDRFFTRNQRSVFLDTISSSLRNPLLPSHLSFLSHSHFPLFVLRFLCHICSPLAFLLKLLLNWTCHIYVSFPLVNLEMQQPKQSTSLAIISTLGITFLKEHTSTPQGNLFLRII